MTNQLSPFLELGGHADIFTAQNGKLRCSAIRLTDGRLCLFSPTQSIGAAALESLQRLGDVAFLLAPNHYHNKALKEFTEVFPAARLCAPQGAIPRLRKVTGLEIETLQDVEGSLPESMDFVEPEGLKTGEVWLRSRNDGGTAWLLVDAFCGPKIAKTRPSSDQPELLKTFPTYGVGDRTAYKDWVRKQIRRDKPETLVPCHGAILRAEDLPAKLEKLVDEVL